MALSDFVVVNITALTRTPTRVGFGTPMVAGFHTAWPDRVRTYQSTSDMAADGITSTGVGAATYWNAAAIFSQNPRVKQIKVGRRTNAWTQKVQLIVTTAVAGTVYKVSIGPLGGSLSTFTRTVPGSSTIAAEVTAIKALIDAAGFAMTTASAAGNTAVECTANVAGTMFVFTNRNPELQFLETTAAPGGISTDLDAIAAADNDWYGFVLDSSSKAEAVLAAAWCQPQTKVFFASTGDTENGVVGAASTLVKQLKASGYNRSSVWTNYKVLPSFEGPAIMGEEFPWPPGTGTYLGKPLLGVTVDAPSTTAETETVTQNGNVYTVVSGLSVTRPGVMASGDFIDVIVGTDWLTARLKEAVFGLIASQRRLPYTDGGIAMLRGAVLGVLKRAQGTVANPGFLDPGVDPIVTAPLVADVDPALRALRQFPNLTFSAKISGAIHSVTITGTISP